MSLSDSTSSGDRELLAAVERERLRIAREIHDTAGQQLLAAKLLADTLPDGPDDLSDDVRKRVWTLSDLIGEAVAALRGISVNLTPPELERLGLGPALVSLCRDMAAEGGFHVDYAAAGLEAAEIDFDTAIQIFRIVGESLANVRKHARTGTVLVRLVRSGGVIHIRVEDEGDGAGPCAPDTGTGLGALFSRVRLLGGAADIRSAPGLGFRLAVRIPETPCTPTTL